MGELQWGMECKGSLVLVGGYMNMQLANVKERIDGILSGRLSEVLIKRNNVFYIRSTEEEGK